MARVAKSRRVVDPDQGALPLGSGLTAKAVLDALHPTGWVAIVEPGSNATDELNPASPYLRRVFGNPDIS